MSGPYGEYAGVYAEKGYIPLPYPRGKGETVAGYTGYEHNGKGKVPTAEEIATWRRTKGEQNIGLRCNRFLVGLDFDAYNSAKDTVGTYERLVAECGPLPPTWRVSSRFFDGYDGLSGIRLYRLTDEHAAMAEETVWKSAQDGIDLVRWAHRNIQVPPSIHPSGRVYRVMDERTGEVDDWLPSIEEIPYLPDAWAWAWRKDQPTLPEADAAAPQRERVHIVTPRIDRPTSRYWTEGVPCRTVAAALGRALAELKVSRHDKVAEGVMRLTRHGEQGHEGVRQAVDTLRGAYTVAVTAPGDGQRTMAEADAEWDRMVADMDDKIDRKPTAEEDKGCCSDLTPTTTVDTTTGEVDDRIGVGNLPTPTVEVGEDRDATAGQSTVAARLVKLYRGKFMFVPGVGWHAYDGRRWHEGNGMAELQVRQAVIATAQRIIRDAAKVTNPEMREAMLKLGHRTLSSSQHLSGVAEFVKLVPTVLVPVTELNPDPLLLNLTNGTFDLRTGTLRPHDPADRITRVAGTSYEPGATSARWDLFLAEALEDPDLIAATLRCFGGAGLPGHVREHVLPIITGPGGTGKGTFINTIAAALGDYAIAAEPDLFLGDRDAHPTGQMDLLGVRLAFVSENDEGKQMAAATMKRLTGGDKIRARRMRQDFVQFDPSHLLALITNHLPTMPTNDDPAVWRRVRVVPFTKIPAKVDKALPDALLEELPGVLASLLNGYADYVARGMDIAWPKAVEDATARYRGRSDTLGTFLDETTEKVHEQVGVIPTGEVYAAWKAWLVDNAPDVRPGRTGDFVQKLVDRGETVVTDSTRSVRTIVRGRRWRTAADVSDVSDVSGGLPPYGGSRGVHTHETSETSETSPETATIAPSEPATAEPIVIDLHAAAVVPPAPIPTGDPVLDDLERLTARMQHNGRSRYASDPTVIDVEAVEVGTDRCPRVGCENPRMRDGLVCREHYGRPS